jgi:peptide/nickel transport system permease protein
MHRYLVRRLLAVVPVLFGISVLVFLMMALLPGDPAQAILGPYATPENVATLREELELDSPLPVQFVTWLGNVVQGDFGRSYSLDRPVLAEVLQRLGPTLLLAGAALALSVVLGLAVGVITAVKQYRWQDKLLTLLVLVGISTPAFWLGLLFILLFAVWLGAFPVSGMYDVYGGGGWLDMLHHLVLPAGALAAVATAVIARLTRTQMLEVLRQDYIRTARAKGLKPGRIVYRHAFRNALVSVVPIIGLQAGFVLGGAVYIETVFEWPGLGRMLVNAIATRDILLVQGGVLIVAAAYVFINLITDLIQYALDPRIKVT